MPGHKEPYIRNPVEKTSSKGAKTLVLIYAISYIRNQVIAEMGIGHERQACWPLSPRLDKG